MATKPEKNTYRSSSLPFVSERRIGAFYSYRLAHLARLHKPEIIHTHTEFPLGIFGRTLAHELGIPHVHTYHTIYEDYTHFIVKFGSLDTVAKAATRVMSRVFCNSANEVIVPTQKVKDLLLSYKVERPIHILPTGIEIDRFNPKIYRRADITRERKRIGLLPEDRVLLNIGRVSEEKSLDEVIRYSAGLLRQDKNLKLVFIGNGPELEEYKALAAELKLSDQVIFAGARPWDEIGLYYQIGDLFVSASQSETQGLTYIESMAAGLPVIARRDPCLDHVISEGENGFMYDDEADYVKAVKKCLGDKRFYRSLQKGALKQAEHFSAAEFARRMLSLYGDVMARFTTNIIQSEEFYLGDQ